VRRLEPGDEVLAIAGFDAAKSHKGAHLVYVAPDRLLHRLEAADVGVGCDLQKLGLSSQSPEQAVEQGEALRIAVADDGLGS